MWIPMPSPEFEAEGETITGQEIENIFYVTPKSANMLKSLSSLRGGSGRKTMAERIGRNPKLRGHYQHQTRTVR